MRTNMDPLAPTTSTLSPAISYIAETAASLSNLSPVRGGLDAEGAEGVDQRAAATRRKQQQQQETVRWVLAAPHRLRMLINAGREDEAADDWVEIQRLLGKWEGVEGVGEIRSACTAIIGSHDSKGKV